MPLPGHGHRAEQPPAPSKSRGKTPGKTFWPVFSCLPPPPAGVNVTMPSQPGTPPLSSTQLQVEPGLQEFQLVDLSRRFLAQDSFWALPSQFLGNKVRSREQGGQKPGICPSGGLCWGAAQGWVLSSPSPPSAWLCLQVDSYGGHLHFKVRYGLGRGQSEPLQKPSVVLVGNGQKLIYRAQVPTQPSVVNQRQVQFIEVGVLTPPWELGGRGQTSKGTGPGGSPGAPPPQVFRDIPCEGCHRGVRGEHCRASRECALGGPSA